MATELARFRLRASEIMGIPEAAFMMFVKEYPTDSIATGGVTLENKSK